MTYLLISYGNPGLAYADLRSRRVYRKVGRGRRYDSLILDPSATGRARRQRKEIAKGIHLMENVQSRKTGPTCLTTLSFGSETVWQ